MSLQNSVPPSCNCAINRILSTNDAFIFVTGSQKQSNASGGKSYIAYTIRLRNIETKHRYSEFESLWKSFTKLYPAAIVPPIPEKHSIVDYAALQTRFKDDIPMIEKRKRMLQSFLNRAAKHPILGRDHVFHRFLESGVLWSDVLLSPPLSVLPRNPLQRTFSNPTSATHGMTNPILANHLVPVPSTAYLLKHPDQNFEESEQFAYRVANYMNNHLEKIQRKVVRRLGELASDYAELGAVYNGFSLNEDGEVANAIEKIGQAVDTSYSNTGEMVTTLEGDFAEPIQEYSQFAHTIKQILRFRHMKHAQVEMIEGSLQNKKDSLDALLEIEEESQRLEEAIAREHTIRRNAADIDDVNYGTADAFDGQNAASHNVHDDPFATHHQIEYDHDDNHVLINSPSNTASHQLSSHTKQRSRQAWSGPLQMVNAVGHTLQGLIDMDPVATRRNQIGKTKDAISVLEQALDITRDDLKGVSLDVQTDLDRFQQEKIEDMKDMLIAYAKAHIRYCNQNLELWQEVKDEVSKIPNQV
ncbi:hypothetical protein BCR42DRAFT_404936 [Absidia repens]|uniref:PX domain-containing protein n=1 Tax=Absidia repens TaxID=90262 RepID=A0A1X2IWV3_9FUNG|nr:hypothetical protein BCR42DRAFT_404936 [Absidia repens]